MLAGFNGVLGSAHNFSPLYCQFVKVLLAVAFLKVWQFGACETGKEEKGVICHTMTTFGESRNMWNIRPGVFVVFFSLQSSLNSHVSWINVGGWLKQNLKLLHWGLCGGVRHHFSKTPLQKPVSACVTGWLCVWHSPMALTKAEWQQCGDSQSYRLPVKGEVSEVSSECTVLSAASTGYVRARWLQIATQHINKLLRWVTKLFGDSLRSLMA